MKNRAKGFSLGFMSKYYDMLTPAERSRWRRKQIALVELKEGENVLEAGCGTGSLSILAKLAVGDTGRVWGIDITSKMINKAKEKARNYKLDIDFESASVTELPFPDERFDVVISTLMFHHLPPRTKKEGLKEIYRVLKRDGRFFLTDFCTPGIIMAPIMFLLLVWLRSTRFQLFGKLPTLIVGSGFRDIKLAKKGLFLKYYFIKK
jgi:ubiquinone/menaquinone biosynthesis C-methylase UbiE